MVDTNCKMCGGVFKTNDRRRKYCDECRKARKRIFNANRVNAFRERKREKLKKDAEMLEGLKVENELLREIIARQNAKLRRAGIESEEEI